MCSRRQNRVGAVVNAYGRARWLAVLASAATVVVVAAAFLVLGGEDGEVAVATTTTLPDTTPTSTSSTTSTTTSSSTSTSTTSTTTPPPTTTAASTTTLPPTTTVAPTTTVVGPNGRVVGTALVDPQDPGELLVAALAQRTPADHVVSPGSPADIYQRWARSVPGSSDATITASGYAFSLDRVVELRGFVLDEGGLVADFTECLDDACRAISPVVIWPEMCGSYTCGTVFSSDARFPIWLVATLYTRPDTPIQMFELRSDESVATVDDAGGVVWFDPDNQRLVITLPRHPAPGTQTVIAMTMASGSHDFTAVVYDD